MFGLVGKILRVNLTERQINTINTEDYRDWLGGHGLGAALFLDLARDKTVSSFDTGNVLVITPGLFSGTLVPASSRTEIVGIQAQSYPYEWFSSSNGGGRFASMLKYAGFDAIVLEGAADKPTWINIVDSHVELRDATNLWGLDTYETQKTIFREVMGSKVDCWAEIGSGKRTTQRPSVLAIGPAGESRSRMATIQTDTGNAFGQGGFGGVWGSKNLKAISVLGTGSVEVADPEALMEARVWAERNYGADVDNPRIHAWQEFMTSHFGGHPGRLWTPWEKQRRSSGCYSCHLNCRPKTSTGIANRVVCTAALFYQAYDEERHGKITDISGKASDLVNRIGLNAMEIRSSVGYVKALSDQGILGRGKKIDTDLPIDKLGEIEFIQDFLHKIAYRKDIGDDLAEGVPRAAERWGRLDDDLRTGLIPAAFWGYRIHYDARTEAYWGYASIVSGRDINCHDFNVPAYWMPSMDIESGTRPLVTAEEVANIIGGTGPYYDPEMIDFATGNLYSIHMARTTAWVLHYGRFWKMSCGLCDNAFPDFINPYGPGNRGLTPEGELKFYRAVTGQNLSFEDSMEMGRRIFNLDKAIWTLQGRHRDMEKFAEFVYSVDSKGRVSYLHPQRPPSYWMTTKENEKWDYRNVVPRHLDRDKVEEWKTIFYELEGWDPKTGWQTRATLEALGLDRVLNRVIDELKSAGKLT